MAKMASTLVLLALTAGLAAAAGDRDLPKLASIATIISREAARGDWAAAHADAASLKSQWTAIRPSVATTRLQTAHAETIDASIAWMTVAIDQRNKSSVQDSASFVVRTVNHLVEDHGQQ